MSARILDGKRIAEELIDRIAERVAQRRARGLRAPGLAVILVGDDPASAVYVRNKRRACERAGFVSRDFDLPAGTGQAELMAMVAELNQDPVVDGILVQFPLPAHLDAHALIQAIRPDKDVDGFHPENVGRLALRQPGLRPCTPKGVMNLLAHTDQSVRGRHAVVVGASNHVGRPMALELLLAGATVTSTHRFTQDLQGFVGMADILVVAVGRRGLVPGEWVKPGSVVIDVGINRDAQGHLCGDVDFAAAAARAAWITPVPGGVGPMTVATLMQNTLEAAEQHS
ncbi:MAG TPA: bifunctional methylenetetrahydrofolate dehydrogenase/methenyltetrahydrofolate cyclohydrolase FolD [Xanthomonadaceae bacterium]|nr:bifunctional methylenetetrahydrofolate dehydrogenase/methenyltetrahydrofolate cyclohydrolase FolD [Xanthomonadaceae bacterium]